MVRAPAWEDGRIRSSGRSRLARIGGVYVETPAVVAGVET
jgi:hypothetical protein